MFFDELSNKVSSLLKYCQTRNKNDLRLAKEADEYFDEISKPLIMCASPKNEIVIRRKRFEKLCLSMEESKITNPKKRTVFEFNSIIDHYEAKQKTRPK